MRHITSILDYLVPDPTARAATRSRARREHPAAPHSFVHPRHALLDGNPRSADLRSAMLDGIDLRGRDLSGLDLEGAYLRKARLGGASLVDANLRAANLAGCDLADANLTGADLLDALLVGANLIGANLSGARHLVMANLRQARYNRTTIWPAGFDPRQAGAVPMSLVLVQ